MLFSLEIQTPRLATALVGEPESPFGFGRVCLGRCQCLSYRMASRVVVHRTWARGSGRTVEVVGSEMSESTLSEMAAT